MLLFGYTKWGPYCGQIIVCITGRRVLVGVTNIGLLRVFEQAFYNPVHSLYVFCHFLGFFERKVLNWSLSRSGATLPIVTFMIWRHLTVQSGIAMASRPLF